MSAINKQFFLTGAACTKGAARQKRQILMSIMKHPKHLWFTAIIISLLQLTACSKAPVTSSQPGQKNESLQPKPFKGEVYESVDGQHRITLTSPDEAEISEGGQNIVCKYTKQDGKLRLVVTALGTTKAEYFQITTDGLQDDVGTIYFTPTRIEAARQFAQGVRYATGEGVAKDEAEAVKWFRKAADQNFARAQCSLGTCYANGRGVAKDEAEAVKWFRKAADQNNAEAQNNLGFCYEMGQGVAKDELEAVKWYRKAAEQNYAVAQNNLGTCYANGRGVAKDEAEAVKWFRRVAEQNLAMAQNNLGICYANGRGVAKDESEAVKWYLKAAEQNYAMAQNNLGFCYFYGKGVAEDYVKAAEWLSKAAEGGVVNGFNGFKDFNQAKGWGMGYGEVVADGLNWAAWHLATSPDLAVRNGTNAVAFAEKAVTVTNRKKPNYLGTLAAAYAEVGQFEKAVSTQQEAIALLQTEAEKNDYGSRLKLYEAKVPYHQAKD